MESALNFGTKCSTNLQRWHVTLDNLYILSCTERNINQKKIVDILFLRRAITELVYSFLINEHRLPYSIALYHRVRTCTYAVIEAKFRNYMQAVVEKLSENVSKLSENVSFLIDSGFIRPYWHFTEISTIVAKNNFLTKDSKELYMFLYMNLIKPVTRMQLYLGEKKVWILEEAHIQYYPQFQFIIIRA
ncbi:hypothetical protein ACJX0J_021603, partial [Zea mays]